MMGGNKRGSMAEETGEESKLFIMTPMSRKIRLEPGEVYEGSITVINPMTATEPFQYKIGLAPYSVADGDYTVDLMTRSSRSQIMDWITIEESVGTIEPNEDKEIHYTIKVPENAEAGGQYAAITVGSDERDDSNVNGVSIKNMYEMASIIYAQIGGDIKRGGGVLTNEITGFVLQPPIKLQARVSNEGNIHETAVVRIKVKNFLNGAQVYPADTDEMVVEEVIMPETERTLTQEVGEIPSLGLYEAVQSIEYLGETSYNSRLVVACPIWFMLMVLIVLAIIGFGIGWAIRKHRRKKDIVVM